MKKIVRPLWSLLEYVQLSKSHILFAALCSVFNKICDIVPEILIGISIDVVVNQRNSLLATVAGIQDPYYQLILVGALTALLWILESIFEYLYSVSWRSLAQSIQHDLRLQTYDKIQKMDLAYFENRTTGGLLSIMHDDINQLEQFLSQGPNEIIQLVVNILVMGCIFFYLSPVIAFLTLLPIPFVIGIAYYFQHKLARLYQSLREVTASLSSHIAYRLQGIATIKSYAAQDFELKELTRESDTYQAAQRRASHVQAEYIPLVRMAIMAGFIMSLVVGGIYCLQGRMPINWYAALVFLTQRFLWPFTSLSTITDMYERASASAARVLDVLRSKSTIVDGPEHLTVTHGAVEFRNVSFAYADGTQLFKNLSFDIPARTTVAFVGATGSGKSTLIKLLLRFYDPQSGALMIDGQNIESVKLDELRRAIGLVSQDVYMVEGTIAQNISYGSFAATQQQIEHAAKLAQADDFIRTLPQGYATRVQEHGKNLSGGQRQRLSIARALLKKSPLLIFDEATSAIDNETEAALQQSLAQLAHQHTMIIIAHRLSTVRTADTIFVLDHGAIVEQGNHEELLKRNGIYAQLVKLGK